MWGLENNLWELVPSFHHISPEGGAQVTSGVVDSTLFTGIFKWVMVMQPVTCSFSLFVFILFLDIESPVVQVGLQFTVYKTEDNLELLILHSQVIMPGSYMLYLILIAYL